MKKFTRITEIEDKKIRCIAEYIKRKGLEKDDGIALVLLTGGDKPSEKMIRILTENPDMDFDELFQKALEISENGNYNVIFRD